MKKIYLKTPYEKVTFFYYLLCHRCVCRIDAVLILHIATFFVLASCEKRNEEEANSPYISRIIEYMPAPGQFINETGIGTLNATESIVGGISGLVSLGGFGGYIIVGFDHTVMNDPENPFGVDFIVVGNAITNSSEPGIVMVMADTNGNGIPDDGEWYELKGSRHDAASSIAHYAITYVNPGQPAGVAWTDNHENQGSVKVVPFHRQAYYPSAEYFPAYPQDSITLHGTLIQAEIDSSNMQFIRLYPPEYGYADTHPFTRDTDKITPDNPWTPEIEGNGGDAFDIDWATDANGNPVTLKGIDFIKIYTAVNVNAGRLGELSTEICGIIDIAPEGDSGF
ncbi:MAG: hypothetical protein LBS09_06670 [Bacteroidales bacterium]|jgi:hypothetical protein|nr:hypothetical protein [Bacteroidales bacterium]